MAMLPRSEPSGTPSAAEGHASVEHIVDSLASIKKLHFRVATSLFFAIALASIIARVGVRIYARRRLSLDDYLLFLATICLIGSFAVLQVMFKHLYLYVAIQADQSLVARISPADLNELINYASEYFAAFHIISWTATFLVKFCFLAFFRQLIQGVDNIKRYYWFVVALTFASWVYTAAEKFIVCPYYGAESAKCLDPSRDILYFAMAGLITGLDALTDIMIISIPIIILRRVRIRLTQKISLGSFMCLSAVMIITSIIRVSKIKGKVGMDLPWKFFWMFMESAVAVFMGSFTVFRSLLLGDSSRSSNDRRGGRPSYSFRNTFNRMGHRKRLDSLDTTQDGLPSVPGGTITGLRSFINGHRRDDEEYAKDTTSTSTHQLDTLDEHDGPLVHDSSERFHTRVSAGKA